jgi:hypothetical protein
MNVECPTTMLHHVQKVLAGEYEVPYRATRPVISSSSVAWSAHLHRGTLKYMPRRLF